MREDSDSVVVAVVLGGIVSDRRVWLLLVSQTVKSVLRGKVTNWELESLFKQ